MFHQERVRKRDSFKFKIIGKKSNIRNICITSELYFDDYYRRKIAFKNRILFILEQKKSKNVL